MDIETYKRTIARLTEHYGNEMEKLAKELRPVKEELKKLEQMKPPSPENTKKIADLRKKQDTLRKKIEAVAKALDDNVRLIPPATEAAEKELVKLPAWMKELILKWSIHLGDTMSITPKIELDSKLKKFKSASLILRF
jgi:DNA repair ATPase RecN